MSDLEPIYKQILRNCYFYESEGDEKKLLNEIGALRGVAYCIESTSKDIKHAEGNFLHFIQIQNELLSK